MAYKTNLHIVLLVTLVVFAGLSSSCKTTKPALSVAALIKSGDLAVECRTIIGDAERAERVVAQLSKLDDLIEEFQTSQTSHQKKMKTLLADFDSSSSDLQDQLKTFNEQRVQRRIKLRRISDSIRSETTPEEWDRLKKNLKKTMISLIALAQQP